MMIRLSGSAPPTQQIRDQIRGLIESGQLAADQRLPSVRQVAKDLGVAPGTVAKAYKALEEEGILRTRTAGGTRVSPNATTTPGIVIDAARQLAERGVRAGIGLEDALRVVRAVWPADQPATEHAADADGD